MEESYYNNNHTTTNNNNNQQLQNHQRKPKASSRLGLRTSGGYGGAGEIVEVHGGHIVRSTSRKDRHSKVCTAKGPRDRRVRLSAHTAIQFYDVQDRLGYDRPSKAVDWLIKKAKTAIDKLAELPAWKPTNAANPSSVSGATLEHNSDELDGFNQLGDDRNSSFLHPSLDSESATLFSRSTGRNQDLQLSLQSVFQRHSHSHHHRPETQECNDNDNENNNNNNNNLCFDATGWSGYNNNQTNPGNGFQRTVGWSENNVFDNVSVASGGFVFGPQVSNSNPPVCTTTPFLQPLFGQAITSELFNNRSQREPLQSSTAPLFRAWIDPMPPFSGVGIDQHPTLGFHRPCSGLGGFSGLGVPTRIEGEQEEHDGVSGRPSSTSSDSRH